MNMTIISGNLTRDPELMETQNGVAYCKFTVAVNGESTGTDGNRPTYFYSCTAWKGRAENIGKYLKKGSKVLVKGEMQSRSYEDKDGVKRTAWDLLVSNIEFLSTKQGGDDTEESTPTTTTAKRTRPAPTEIDQLPF